MGLSKFSRTRVYMKKRREPTGEVWGVEVIGDHKEEVQLAKVTEKEQVTS